MTQPVCMGHGAKDTHAFTLNDGRDNPHPSAGHPYATIGPADIYQMVLNPPQVDKEAGPWIIPSSYHNHDARNHKAQHERGQYHWLAVDIDKGSPSKDKVVASLQAALGQANALVYSTRSATAETFKWRALIPLAQPLTGKQYTAYQQALFHGLQERCGLQVDWTLERVGQLVYLPNRGEYYDYAVLQGETFDALAHAGMSKVANDFLQAAERYQSDVSGKQEGARSPIAAFRRKHSVAELLQVYGYVNKAGTDDWTSPNSASGSASTRDYGDYWTSLGHGDRDAGIGRKANNSDMRTGDAFDLYVFYQCGGNRELALQYAEQCLKDEDKKRLGAATPEHGAFVWECMKKGFQERLQEELQAEIPLAAPADAMHEYEEAVPADADIWDDEQRDDEELLEDAIMDKLLDVPVFPREIPKGLVGSLAKFLYNAANYPFREVSLTTSLAFMAGLVGREFRFSGAGLNEYFVSVTGAGLTKQIIMNGPNLIAHQLEMRESCAPLFRAEDQSFISLFPMAASGQGYHTMLSTAPSGTAQRDEFGEALRKMMADRSSVSSEYSMILQLYGMSGRGGRLSAMTYSDKKNNKEAVERPAFSLHGATTHSVYDEIDSDTISGGLIPRMLISDSADYQPPENMNAHLAELNEQTKSQLEHLALTVYHLRRANSVINLELAPGEASEERLRFSEYCRRQRNHASKHGHSAVQSLWGRVALHVWKIAGIVALGRHPNFHGSDNVLIQMEDINFAKKYVGYCMGNLMRRAKLGNFQGPSSRRLQAARELVIDYLQMPASTRVSYGSPQYVANQPRCISRRYLFKRMSKLPVFNKEGTRDMRQIVDTTLATMVELGELSLMSDLDVDEIRGLTAKGRAGRNPSPIYKIEDAIVQR